MPLTSKTEVCNLALAEVFAKRINSFEADTSVEAITCRLHFDHIVETLLRRHQWSFATHRDSLSKLPAPPQSEWSAAWQLPANFIRLIRIVGFSVDNPIRDFSLEGRQLLTAGGDVLKIVYVRSDTPVPYWDALFTEAVKLKLAAAIAGDVKKNPQISAACTQKLEQLSLPAAQTADAREVLSGENMGPGKVVAMSSLVASRFSRGGRVPFISPPSA